MKKTIYIFIPIILISIFFNITTSLADNSTFAKQEISNLKATSGVEGVTLTWNKMDNADGYKIYVKKGDNGELTLLKTLSMPYKTSYLDKKASAIDDNHYWVYPYSGNTNALCSNPVNAKKILVEDIYELSATGQIDGIFLNWSKSENATGYKIYVQRGEDANLTWISTIKDSNTLQFIDKEASSDTYNYYWVYPYNENAIGRCLYDVYGKKGLLFTNKVTMNQITPLGTSDLLDAAAQVQEYTKTHGYVYGNAQKFNGTDYWGNTENPDLYGTFRSSCIL